MNKNWDNLNARNIYEHITDKRMLLLCIDGLDMDEPKIKLRFCNIDKDNSPGSKLDEITCYMNIGKFLVFANDVLSGLMLAKKRQAEKTEQKHPVYYEAFSGTYDPPLSKNLQLVNGMGDAPFALVASIREGFVGENKIIKPVAGAKPISSVFINTSAEDLKEMALIGQTYIEQYIGLMLREKLAVVRKQRSEYKQRGAENEPC